MANYGLPIEQRLAGLLPPVERERALLRLLSQSLRVALPAVVQSFQPGPPATVSVLVATKELVEANQGETALSLATQAVQLPLLQDVPVAFPSAGGWSMTFPIQPGDECLLVFADTPLDVWWQNGGTENNPISQRRHSLSDAIAIFGLRSRPRGLAGYSTTSTQIRNDDQSVVIDLAPGQITVTAPNVAVQCSGAASVQAQTATVTADQDVTVQGGQKVTVKGNQSVTIDGNSQTKVDGKDFLTHKHSGVQGGLATSGPVA